MPKSEEKDVTDKYLYYDYRNGYIAREKAGNHECAANKTLSKLVCDSFSRSFSIEINGREHKFDACIFDFDGVIADTEKFHYLAWNKALASVGVELTPDEYLPLKSTGRANIISFAESKCGLKFTDRQKSDLTRIKDKTYMEAIARINDKDLIAGARGFLLKLKSGIVKTGVASSSKTAKCIMDKLQLSDLFCAVIDGRTEIPKKPAPDIFLAVADMLGVTPQKCLVFEDSPAGIEAALKAGACVIAVGGIKDERALLCIDDFTSLK